MAHITSCVQTISVNRFQPALNGVGILYALYIQVSVLYFGQRTVFVISIGCISIPFQPVFGAKGGHQAVIGIIVITLVELIGKAAVIAEHIYLTTQQIIIIVNALEALLHIIQVRIIMS
ncbi:hypothetical protein D3C72_2112170 [compost metagenome]